MYVKGKKEMDGSLMLIDSSLRVHNFLVPEKWLLPRFYFVYALGDK